MIAKRTYLFQCPVDWPIRGQLLVTTFEDEAPMIAWRQDSGSVWGVAFDGTETTGREAKERARAELHEAIVAETKQRHPAGRGLG